MSFSDEGCGIFYCGISTATVDINKTNFAPNELISISGSINFVDGSPLHSRQVGVALVPSPYTEGSVVNGWYNSPSYPSIFLAGVRGAGFSSGTGTINAPTTPGTYHLVPYIASASLIVVKIGPSFQINVSALGTIRVSSDFAGGVTNRSASYTITGPVTITGSGAVNAASTQTYTNRPAGLYTIIWNSIGGFAKPITQTLPLSSGGTLTFSGTYTSTLGGNIGNINTWCDGSYVMVEGDAWDNSKTPNFLGPWVQIEIAPDYYASVDDYVTNGGYSAGIINCRVGIAGNTSYQCGSYGMPLAGGVYARATVLDASPGTHSGAAAAGEVHISCTPPATITATPGAIAALPDTWWQKLWKSIRGIDAVAHAAGSASIVVNQNLNLIWNSSGMSSCTVALSPVAAGFPLSGLSGAYIIPPRTLDPGTTYTATMNCTGPSGNATDFATIVVAPPTDFKLCPMTPAPITPAMASQMRAYYVTTGTVDCSNLAGAIEVTNSPTINWSSVNAGIATVNNVGNKGLITGVATGTTAISATFMTSVDSENVTVSCTPTAACSDTGPAERAANTCTDSSFMIDDGCAPVGNDITCNGTRTCDFNWKEVGQ